MTETEVMLPQTMECMELPEAERVMEASGPRGLEGRIALLTPSFQTSRLRNGEST